ncbi:hypothetical protein BC936DRAFT_140221 [Jimgerdemannia flammicorona]|uniref:GCS light chain n=1 Tax=Jimgerdemannia flammicorona TaxID=994334 RepID=A0A433AVT1_9FUNG|nr:hypothetical protein BC936DRAFT_140221 [Jimgerdemannia flammicorona]
MQKQHGASHVDTGRCLLTGTRGSGWVLNVVEWLPRLEDSLTSRLTTLIILTGNIMKTGTASLTNSFKKSNLELVAAIKDTFRNSLTHDTASFHHDADTGLLEVPDIRHKSNIPPEDRKELDITAKLFFLPSPSANTLPVSYIDQSLAHLKALLDVDTVDTFVVSFGDVAFDEDDEEDEREGKIKTEDMLRVWKDLESRHRRGVFSKLGVSEFSRARLNTFLSNVDIVPKVNQINLRDCCVMPHELIQYSREKDIELLTHSDSIDILPTETLETLINEYKLSPIAAITPRWVLKYSVIIASRGVVADKGYIVSADAENSVLRT